MKKSLYRMVLLGTCLALCACATVQKPNKVVPVSQPKQVSPSLVQEKKAQYKGLKRKVAIGRFTNETKYGQSFFMDENNDRIGKQALDILSDKLMQTEKFILLERADLDKIQKELSIGNAAPLKNMADYLIVGSISEFGRKTVGKVGVFSRTKTQAAYAKVNIRLIDVYTGEIIYSESGEGEAYAEDGSVLGIGGRAGYDSTLNDKAIDAAITDVASNVIENLMQKPWRSYVLGYENELFIIGGGESQGIKRGDVFDVIAEGKKVKNPQTNTMITLPGKKLASLQVVDTYGAVAAEEVSFCTLVQGNIDTWVEQNNFSGLIIKEHAK